VKQLHLILARSTAIVALMVSAIAPGRAANVPSHPDWKGEDATTTVVSKPDIDRRPVLTKPTIATPTVSVDPVSDPEAIAIEPTAAAIDANLQEGSTPLTPTEAIDNLDSLVESEEPEELATETEAIDSIDSMVELGAPIHPEEGSTPLTPTEAIAQLPDPEDTTEDEPATEVLVSEVLVRSETGEPLPEFLIDEVYRVIGTRPGRTTTRSQLQEDRTAIRGTGYFADVNLAAENTPLGVRVVFVVQPNPVLRGVRVEGAQAVSQEVIDEFFGDQYGEILNFLDFRAAIERLNQWYSDQGFIFAQVIDIPPISPDGIVTLEVAEGIVEDIRIEFIGEEGERVDEDGEPIDGRTREFIVTREMRTQPGDVLDRDVLQNDIERIFRLGLFEDVRVQTDPGDDPRQVELTLQVIERSYGSVAAGGGFSSASGLFASISFQEQNLGGNNQKLGTELQVGERGIFFDVRFTDPWIANDPFRTSYTVNAFSRRSISLVFDGGENEVELDNGDRPRIQRLGGGVTFTRPFSRDPLSPSEWTGSLGLEYQQVSIRDADGDLTPEDEEGNLLSFSDDGKDDLLTLQLGLARDRRNNRLQPTSGDFLRFGTEQSAPIGSGSIFFNRLQGSYSRYFPIDFTDFTDGPETLAFNVRGGTVLGDLPPYEAFILGGTNSVRGYGEGEVGAGRSFALFTAEYRFPILPVLGGVLFFDAGSDLGTGDNVPGEPAIVRDKPGSGLGYGVGVRIQSPIGPIRLDFGFNDEGDTDLHFGIGERF